MVWKVRKCVVSKVHAVVGVGYFICELEVANIEIAGTSPRQRIMTDDTTKRVIFANIFASIIQGTFLGKLK